ncbi:RagB/SusD family nutrient uptake outer membrane protein [Adhaeribacter swui]|uniref:RagB/SusD family nutrient uptake outer membrane protein n=1 Tax=Adhaeribacter swui TaxID=2086471 RepID=A0A7G7G7S0_9BACT|nr:RagB/SusD family nutrient uptake outer membrane protein [Adhaeribacter swui]QNF33204.1 RagB/SusD family nutrient uptake outer membrane protein [Adhaeribacter swui]
MKNKIYMLGLMSILLSSCSDDFLELAPISNANVQNFYRNAQDMQVAVNAAYSALQLEGQYRTAYWQMGEVRSDNTMNMDVAGNFPDAEIDLFKTAASNSIITAAWNDNYRGILLCNVVQDRIAAVTMDEALKNQYLGEVKFLRGLMYFNLVRIFGDVPLVLKETKSVEEGYQQPRVAKALIYEQIVKDLTEATQSLPDKFTGNDIGRATKGAALALLGKVYLTQKDYAAAAAKLKEVISSGTFQLVPDYANLWGPANENNVESIFEVQFKKGGTGTGSNFYNQFAPWNSETAVTGVGFASGKNLPTADIANAYEPHDLRKASSMAESYVKNGVAVEDKYTIKYRDLQPFAAADADNNWVVLRYADVLLMYAEALNALNQGPSQEAYDVVNAVRNRAGLEALPTGLTYESFSSALEHERQVELAFEGHRWFDLVRTDRAIPVMNAHFNGTLTIDEHHLVFPVPQSQINVNPEGIPQNPGYTF